MPAVTRNEERVRVLLPPPPRAGIFVEGSLADQAQEVIRKIREQTDLF
jgi:hypothetical protein